MDLNTFKIKRSEIQREMKNKNIIMIIGISFVLIIIVIFFVINFVGKSAPQREFIGQTIKVISVDKIVIAPEQYKGFFGVEGRVIKVDESKGLFLLGCEDACVVMPVKWEGLMPEQGCEIIVYGKLRKSEDNRYVFQGKEVKKK